MKGVLQGAFRAFIEDRVLTLGAALAYYAIFSLGPLLVIVIGIAGLVFSDGAAQQQATNQLQSVLGDRGAEVIKSMMASQTRKGSVLATIIGSIVLLLGASGVFGQLKSSLNIIWHVKAKPGRGLAGLLFDRFISLFMVLGIGLLLMTSMLVAAALSIFSEQLNRVIPMPAFVAILLNLFVSFLVVTLLFALIFKWLPDVNVAWRDVWIGAMFTAALFLLGEFLLSLYLGREGTTSAYGAAGSVVLLLMWIYYSSLILFFGAEFTKVRVIQRGVTVAPGKYAVPVEEPYLGLLRHKPA